MYRLILSYLILSQVLDTQARGQEQQAERRLRSVSAGTVAVLILPSLSPALLKYINEQTCYYKVGSIKHDRMWLRSS